MHFYTVWSRCWFCGIHCRTIPPPSPRAFPPDQEKLFHLGTIFFLTKRIQNKPFIRHLWFSLSGDFWIWDALLLGFSGLLGGWSGFAVHLSSSYFFVWVVRKRANEDTKEHSPHYVPWHGSILKYHSKSVSNVNPMILWGRINPIFFFKSFKMNLVSLINHVISREI